MKKKTKEFLENLSKYTDSKTFEDTMLRYCEEKGITFTKEFHEGCRAGMMLSMAMHFSSKNKKTSEFLEKWIKEMAAVNNPKLKSN